MRLRCTVWFKRRGTKKKNMGFIMEWAEDLIRRNMEDPKERERKRREYLYAVKERCKERLEVTSLPMRPYGFWTFDRQNLHLYWAMQISHRPGRSDPYDEISADPFDNPKK